MIHLLFALVLAEMALVLALLFRTPLRELVTLAMDYMKQGKGPVVTKTVAVTIMIVFFATLHNVMDIQRRSVESGVINPTDEVLLANRLLEASLMGFALFLAIVTDRLHYYIQEINLTRRSLEAATTRTKMDHDYDDHGYQKKPKELKVVGFSKVD